MQKHWIIMLLLAAVMACSAPEEAPAPLDGAWSLVPDNSQIAFVSIKADSVGEAHRFLTESGAVDASGKAEVTIDLSSVDTAVDIRDERMRDILFQVEQFPDAKVGAQIDPKLLETLKLGEQKTLTTPLSLELHGVGGEFDADLAVTRIADDRVLVETVKPVIVDATQFALGEGLDQLREIAGLPSISPAVPVTASLVFAKDGSAQ